ncbi:MAG: hypothetical protein HY268_13675 [Deltaproteobacteria bacterium]|nr:hypothetical protein [Deltaproteobacteria bacterium]
MRAALLFSLFFSLMLCGPVVAQPSPYGSAGGNLGTWSWDKSQPAKSDEDEERAPGETSWERLNAEHQPAVEQAPKEIPIIQSLSPLRLWRWLRGTHEEPNAEQNNAQDDGQNTDQSEEQTDEQTAEPANE